MGAARVVVVVSTLLEHQLGDLCCATRVAERVLRVPVHVVRVLRATIIRVDFTGIPCAQFRRALLRALRKYVSLVLFFWLEAGGWRHNTGAARVSRDAKKRVTFQHPTTRFPKRESCMHGVLNKIYL